MMMAMAKSTLGGKKSKKVKKNKKKKDLEKFMCPYELEYEGRQQKIIANCKDCDGQHMLGEGQCTAGILNIYSKEYGVNDITISHYIERQHFGEAIDLLNYMKIFSNTLENLSLRDPLKEYLGMVASSQKRKIKCNICSFNPNIIFSNLRAAFVEDIGVFYHAFSTKVREIESSKIKRKPCDKCLGTTIEDLEYIYDIYENLAEQILSKGFSVMLTRSTPKKSV